MNAIFIAIDKAILSLKQKVENAEQFVLLLDAMRIPSKQSVASLEKISLVHGDKKSVAIAYTSIIAKIYCDKKVRLLQTKHS